MTAGHWAFNIPIIFLSSLGSLHPRTAPKHNHNHYFHRFPQISFVLCFVCHFLFREVTDRIFIQPSIVSNFVPCTYFSTVLITGLAEMIEQYFTKLCVHNNSVVQIGGCRGNVDSLHLLEASQGMTLWYELRDGTLMQGTSDEKNDIVDHVAVPVKMNCTQKNKVKIEVDISLEKH